MERVYNVVAGMEVCVDSKWMNIGELKGTLILIGECFYSRIAQNMLIGGDNLYHVQMISNLTRQMGPNIDVNVKYFFRCFGRSCINLRNVSIYSRKIHSILDT